MPTASDRSAARARALAALADMTDDEDAAITRAALADPDNPPLDAERLAAMRPAVDVIPEIVRRTRGQRGAGRRPAKIQVALRLDLDLVEKWRATGAGWQTRMGEALRIAIEGGAPKRR